MDRRGVILIINIFLLFKHHNKNYQYEIISKIIYISKFWAIFVAVRAHFCPAVSQVCQYDISSLRREFKIKDGYCRLKWSITVYLVDIKYHSCRQFSRHATTLY